MADFPTLSLNPTLDYSDEIIKPIVKTKFEGNYAQSRPKYTRSMQNFNLTFKMITQTDKTALQTFFSANSGSSFNWTNPTTAIVYVVRFAEDKLKFKNILDGFFDVSISLEEV